LEALLLARPGIYGLIIYNAEESIDEIGIRVALGASYGRLLRIKQEVRMELNIPGQAWGTSAENSFSSMARPNNSGWSRSLEAFVGR
jgi:hypothetical protein